MHNRARSLLVGRVVETEDLDEYVHGDETYFGVGGLTGLDEHVEPLRHLRHRAIDALKLEDL